MDRERVFLYNTKTKELKTIVTGINARFTIHQVKGKWYTHTNYKANNFRMLVADLANLPASVDELDEFIPEKERVLEGVSITGDRVLAEYMVNACSQVTAYDLKGKKMGELPLPPFSSLLGIASQREEREFFFGVGDFLTTKTIYRYDPQKDDYEVFRQPELSLETKDFVVKQEWYKSTDDTEVPMFVIHKSGLNMNGQNPTVLYGYGGYKRIQSPGFPAFWVPLLERGAIYAVANIRGGGEFGASWHKQGIKEHKQQSFDDFIAAAEHLVEQKYTSPEKLSIVGGSNGGLLVGACMVQRPDLYKAVVCRVPLLDMVRFPRFLIASRWIHEYGNPEIKNEFDWIIKWSPYHNVKIGTEYPNVLFMTSENDGRVHSMHAWKMTALLQSYEHKNATLLRTETRAGHGAGKPKSKAIQTQAETLTFLAWQLGLQVKA